jgi:glucokinase
MVVIGIDLGGTKLSSALFSPDGAMKDKTITVLEERKGKDVGILILRTIYNLLKKTDKEVISIGISVPGIYNPDTGCVWAPNIPGWEKYPLLDEIITGMKTENIGVTIDSDRSCYILGETWLGAARGYASAIFLAVGTGIGAGIMVHGNVVRGWNGCAGSAGWLALDRPYEPEYNRCGCFEYHASGEGIARKAREMLSEDTRYDGILCKKDTDEINTYDVFDAYTKKDPIAIKILDESIKYWGMAVANLVSLFDPEIIVLGGGIFGPAAQFLSRIRHEAMKWAQPVSGRNVKLSVSMLGNDAGLIGAARLAILMDSKNSGVSKK